METPPPLGARVMERVLNRNPELAHLKDKLTASPAPANDEAAAGEDEAAKAAAAAAKAAGGEADPNKPGAGAEEDPNKGGDPNASGEAGAGEEDEPVEEIEDGDAPEVQLEKLRKAQKKTLKRLDKLAAERNELQRKLEEAQTKVPDAPGLSETPNLADVQDVETLNKRADEIGKWVQHLTKHASTGLTIRGADGQEREMAPEEVLEEILFWTEVRANEVPKRQKFLEARAQARTAAAEKFKPWQDKEAFTAAKAAVEPGMKAARDLLEDYDLAVQERALGRMALSGEWVLVPKGKQPAAGVESAPARKAAPATPPNPPPSGGPAIKPAGTGPDLETLRQNMLKNPGDRKAAAAYVAAVRQSKQAA